MFVSECEYYEIKVHHQVLKVSVLSIHTVMLYKARSVFILFYCCSFYSLHTSVIYQIKDICY